jgi:mevalonate kinase
MCNTILKFLNVILKDDESNTITNNKNGKQDGNGVITDFKGSMPEGSTVLHKKQDNDYMVLLPKKTKKSRTNVSSTLSKGIKMDVELIDQFSKLNLSIPTNLQQAREVVGEVKKKLEVFISEQPAATKLNVENAKLRLAKLRESALADVDGLEGEGTAVNGNDGDAVNGVEA